MSFELIFTSAPKGLKPGSRGFTSVAFTEGMPANYVQICESLSGYVHRYELSDPNYEQNPIAYSHLVGNLGGRTFSILSRVAAYGADYTGRTNKLAHHLMIGFEERVAGGPAHAMKNGAVFFLKWNEDPRFLAPNRIRLQAAEPASLKAKRWEAAIGDAGVAGMLAQAFLDAPDRPAFIVYEPGMDLLPLIAEAQALLPEERRWDVTFSTYFTALPVGMKCAWRCCLPDSDALVTARRTPGALVVNLIDKTITGGPPSDQSLAEVARTGITKEIEATIPPPSAQEMEVAPIQARPTPEAKKAPLRRPLISPDYGKVLKPKPPPQKKKSSPLAQITIFVSLLVLFGVGTFFVSDWLEKRKHSPRDPEPQPVEEAICKEEIQAQVADEPLEKPSELTQEKVASPQPDTREDPKPTPVQEAKPKEKAITLRHNDEVVTYDAPLSITLWDVNAIEITNSSARPAIDGGSLYGPIRYQSGKFSSIPSYVGFIRAEYPAEQVILLVHPVQARFQPLSTNVIFPQGEGGELLKGSIGKSSKKISARLYRGNAGFEAEMQDLVLMSMALTEGEKIRWKASETAQEHEVASLRQILSGISQASNDIQQAEAFLNNINQPINEKNKDKQEEARDKELRMYAQYMKRVVNIVNKYDRLVKEINFGKSESSGRLSTLLGKEQLLSEEDAIKQNPFNVATKANKFSEVLSQLARDLQGGANVQSRIEAAEARLQAIRSARPSKAEILLGNNVIVRAEP